MTSSLRSDIQQLTTAINAQTQAISELAESNRLLVDYLIQGQEEGADTEMGAVYLDPDEEN